MEGHAAALLDDRWMVVVGGFGMRGVENEVGGCVLVMSVHVRPGGLTE